MNIKFKVQVAEFCELITLILFLTYEWERHTPNLHSDVKK